MIARMSGLFEGIVDWSIQFLQHYGYWAVFILMLLETGMILHGVPSELVMTLGATLLAHNPVELFLVILVGTVGAAIGNLLPYWAALYGGRPFILRHPRIFHMDTPRLDRLEAIFRRPVGAFLVFACRLLPFLRAFVSVPAGLARMNFWLFFLLSTLGALLFNTILAYGAYSGSEVFAGLWQTVTIHWFLSSVVAILAVAALWIAWRRRDRLVAHYVRHMPPGWEGAVVAAILAALLLGFLFYAAPATFRAFYEGLRSAGTAELAAWVTPLLLLVGFIVILFLVAAARHQLAAWLSGLAGKRNHLMTRLRPGPPERPRPPG